MALMDLEPCLPKRSQYLQKNYWILRLFTFSRIFFGLQILMKKSWRFYFGLFKYFLHNTACIFWITFKFPKKISIKVFLWYSFYGLKTFWRLLFFKSFSCKFCFFFDGFTIPLVIQGFRSFLFWFSALILETICLKE